MPSSRSSLPAATEEQFSELELLAARTTPAGWAWLVDGRNRTNDPERGWRPYPHLELISNKLMQLAAGQIRRLLITTPPRHGKSNLISRALPGWYLGQHPKRKVILASNTGDLAQDFSRWARDDLRVYGPPVFGIGLNPHAQAAARWETSEGGIVIAAGIDGLITGRGAHLLVVDDPIKTAKEAASEVVRQKQWDWWRAVIRTRLQKDAGIVLVLTRWHEDDIAGRLLAQQRDVDGVAQWEVLNLPALWEPDKDLGELEDALGRDIGQALCPELIPAEDLSEARAELGSYLWTALYMGRPRPAEGMLFKRADFRGFRIELAAADDRLGLFVLNTDEGVRPVDIGACAIFQTADTASSESEMADYTVIGTWAVTPQRDLLLLHIARERFEDTRLSGFMAGVYAGDIGDDTPEVARILKTKPPVRLSVENAASGPKVIRELRDQDGLPVASAKPDTDKVTRALLAIARYEQHKVFHLQGAPWLRTFEDELTGFPNVTHDDQVDVVSYAAIELPRIRIGEQRQRTRGETTMGGMKKKKF